MQPGPSREQAPGPWLSDRLFLFIIFLVFVFVVLGILEALAPGSVLPGAGSVFCVAFLVMVIAAVALARGYRARSALPPPTLPPLGSRAFVRMLAVVVILLGMAVVGMLAAATLTNFGAVGPYPPIILFALIAVIIAVVVGVTTGTGTKGFRLGIAGSGDAPGPRIQQPMAPAARAAPVSLSCPNCGAPPASVDRFGVATCTHCATRFLVR